MVMRVIEAWVGCHCDGTFQRCGSTTFHRKDTLLLPIRQKALKHETKSKATNTCLRNIQKKLNGKLTETCFRLQYLL